MLHSISSLKKINGPVLWNSFSSKEKLLLYLFAMAIFASLLVLLAQFYYSRTNIVPALGGTHREGILGTPRFINPALAQISDADRDISRLVYSGLVKYNSEGQIVEDLAESYSIENDTLYTVKLKENIFWHDGKTLTTEDVIFTIKLIQDPKYASPIRSNWQGVEIKKVDEKTVSFKLASPYSPFLENLTLGILPKHIWENVPPKSFPLSDENLQPVGSGPYKFEKFQKDKEGNIRSYTLKSNERYYFERPRIENIVFKFFESEGDAVRAIKNNELDAMNFVSGHNAAALGEEDELVIYKFFLPRYFAVFFNQAKSKVVSQKEVREALSFSVNRNVIIDTATAGKGSPAFGPIIRELLGYNPQLEEKYKFSTEKAIDLLESNDWLDRDGDGVREKTLKQGEEATALEFNLVTVGWPNFKELEKVVRALKSQWEEIGVRVNINVLPPGELQQNFIRPREYEALLFGQIVGIDPDPFSFWHSSQKKDPGLNLALYENKRVDKLLEDARQTFDAALRAEKYVQFQNIVSEDVPAIFLYSPTYLYPVGTDIKGIREGKIADPSWRFADVEKWYIKTKRVWK